MKYYFMKGEPLLQGERILKTEKSKIKQKRSPWAMCVCPRTSWDIISKNGIFYFLKYFPITGRLFNGKSFFTR